MVFAVCGLGFGLKVREKNMNPFIIRAWSAEIT